MVLELAPDVAAALSAEAARVGQTPEQVAADALRRRFVMPTLEEYRRRLDEAARPDGVAVPPEQLTHEQFKRILDAIGLPIGACLTDDQLRREEIYD